MNNKPTKVLVNGENWDINTDFRTAIKCNSLFKDNTIGDYERNLAVIYLMFGNKGINNISHIEEMMERIVWFLSLGETQLNEEETNKKPDFDFEQDMDYIEASFMSDYGIDLENTKMHWWKFYNLLCGLSNSEMGNCCILNRIRYIRNLDLNKIEDPKEKQEMAKLKKKFEIKEQEPILTQEQIKNRDKFYELLGRERS